MRCAYRWTGRAHATAVRPIRRILDQGPFPTCVGRAFQAAVEAVDGRDVDGLAIWRDARRRAGHTGMTGTYLWTAADSLVHRGVEDERRGREAPAYIDWLSVDLDAELEADDNRTPEWARYRIFATGETRADAIHAALSNGDDVVIGTMVGDALGRYVGGVLDHLGDDGGGHAMRVVGAGFAREVAASFQDVRMRHDMSAIPERYVFALQNSWGPQCGYNGIVLVAPRVIHSSDVLDTHVLRRLP